MKYEITSRQILRQGRYSYLFSALYFLYATTFSSACWRAVWDLGPLYWVSRHQMVRRHGANSHWDIFKSSICSENINQNFQIMQLNALFLTLLSMTIPLATRALYGPLPFYAAFLAIEAFKVVTISNQHHCLSSWKSVSSHHRAINHSCHCKQTVELRLLSTFHSLTVKAGN